MAGGGRPALALALLSAACGRQGAAMKVFQPKPSDTGSFEDSLLAPSGNSAATRQAPKAGSADVIPAWKRDRQMKPLSATFGTWDRPDSAKLQTGAQVKGKAGDAVGLGGAGKDFLGLGGARAGAPASAATAEQTIARMREKIKNSFRGAAGEAAASASSSSSTAASAQKSAQISGNMASDATAQQGAEKGATLKLTDLFGLGEASQNSEMLEDLGTVGELLSAQKGKKLSLALKEDKELGSLKTHFDEIQKASKTLVTGLFNASTQTNTLKEAVQRRRTARERSRRMNLQRQLLRGSSGMAPRNGEPTLRRMDDEERPGMSLLALDGAAPEPGQGKYRAARERLLAKVAAAREADAEAAASVSTSLPASAAGSSSSAAAAEEDAAEAEEDMNFLDENGQLMHGHGEILAKLMTRVEKDAVKIGKSIQKDVASKLRTIKEESEREYGNPNFVVDPAGKVQAVTDKIHRLTEMFTGGLRSLAHDASETVSSKGQSVVDSLLAGNGRQHGKPGQ